MVKLCYKCHQNKGFIYFYKNRSTKDGFSRECIECRRIINHSPKKRQWMKIYRQSVEGKLRNSECAKKYRAKNINYNNEYDKQRKKVDIQFRISKNLRSRLSMAVKSGKSGSAIKDLGCSVGELRKYLEARFQQGMSWGNYGEWHIDHIIPLASFNLQNREEFLKANHHTNLQPLWACENLRKGNKY